MEFIEKNIRSTLSRSWSSQTPIQWKPDNPALGQSNVTSLLVEELFGGQILKTKLQEGFHFYNEINGHRYDFTDSQFTYQIEYDDIRSSREEAEQGITASEMKALRKAFQTLYG